MKENYTHICIVLDASGSMSGVEKATKTTMSNFIEEQKNVAGEATMSIYQFDDESKLILDFQNLAKMADNPMQAYVTGGCTALYDTICDAIDQTGAHLSAMDEADRPSTVIVAILTDGLENASHKFNLSDVKTKIQHQTDVYSWKFMFLAANQDAVLTGGRMGILKEACLNTFTDSREDMIDNARIMSSAIQYKRMHQEASIVDLGSFAEKIRAESTNPRYRDIKNKKTNQVAKKAK